MKAVLIVALTCFLAVIAQPSPPKISEVFSSTLKIFIIEKDHNYTGSGDWSSDQPNGKNVEHYKLNDHEEERLLRYDLHKSFDLNGAAPCQEHNLDGMMPPLWGWLENATYSHVTISGQTYDAWSLTMGYATISILLDSTGKPAYFLRVGEERHLEVQFVSWHDEVTDPTVFDVPSTCPPADQPIPADVGCTARTTMIAAAKVWVDNHVPYNQGATYQGYREDCSGYVSMAWGTSKPGYTTFTMPQISHEIAKDDLQPGDVLLCTSEHVVLFGGWSDAAHSQYLAFEETRPGEGTVSRVTPYPYWYNTGCFIPYRYNLVC